MSRPGWVSVLALACALVAAPVFGQGGTSSATLSGVVVDKDGGNVPGATVVVTKEATGEKLPPQVTNASGAYSFPGLAPGKYKVTISLQGFKTQEIETTVIAGTNNAINTKLEVGQVTEVVNVTSGTDLVRTDTPTVTQSVSANFIQTLPRNNRNALNFLVFLPGVTTVGSTSGYRNNSTIAGLPNVQFNITIDGITNTNMLQSGDGFFSLVTPRLDAVEEVSLTTASAGADAAGQGAVQMRFVTRSGTNKFEVSAYEFMQHAAFNSNSFFNRLSGLPVPIATNHTFGGRVGGPIILPGFDGRGRAFFFFNQEEQYNPSQITRNRTVITPSALAGNFTYNATATNPGTTINVLQLANNAGIAGVNGNYDPQVKGVLDAILAATGKTGTTTNLANQPNFSTYNWLVDNKNIQHAPTTNVTVNLSPKNRLQGSYYWQRFHLTPDTLNSADETFPDFTAFGTQDSFRTTASISLRSTVSTAMVNEARGGWAWAPVGFFANTNPSMFDLQGGANLSLTSGVNATTAPDFNGLTGAAPSRANQHEERNTPNYTASDTFNWLKGAHAMTFGGDYTHVVNWLTDTVNVQNMSLGFETNFDPANAMFTTANFPGATNAQLNGAKSLYALLTGRVRSISGTGFINADNGGTEYVYNGPITDRESQDDFSFYAQDTWRWKPTVTLTYGLRYQYTLPMKAQNDAFSMTTATDACGRSGIGTGVSADGSTDRFCNMFQPGVFLNPGASNPVYIKYDPANKGYNTDLNNLAPVAGVSWRPNVQDGWLRKLLGDPELATVSGGFTRSFVRSKIDQFQSVYFFGPPNLPVNPGASIPADRSTSATAFPLVDTTKGETWPILYSQKNRLGPPDFPKTSAYPIQASNTITNGICTVGCGVTNNFNPDIQVPWTDSWNVSFQRAITKDTVFEARYQGNRSYKAWVYEEWNANNLQQGIDGSPVGGDFYAITANRGSGEFVKAEANLRANVLAGLGPTFAYTGIPGTSPLPIIAAHLNALTPGQANDPANYKGTVWTNTTFTNALNPYSPNPSGFANTLSTGSASSTAAAGGAPNTRYFLNALSLGYPQNYWQVNPMVGNVQVLTNSANVPMNHLVTLQVRRRLAEGLAASVAYTWQHNISGNRLDFHLPLLYLESNGVPHAIQALWSYDIPVGRGKRFGANMAAWEDAIVGGWTFSGTARFQTQSFNLRNTVLVGMTMDEAQKALKTIRFVTDPNSGAVTVFNFPEDIYNNTRLAYATDPTLPTFYGTNSSGQSLAPNGPTATVGPDGQTYRYFAPAGGPECNFVFTGDCGTPTLRFLGRWFGEMDFRLAKAFQLPGHARFEFSAEVFNATKALNFPNTINPSSSANAFRMTTTQSLARTAQLVWRVTW